MKALKRVLLVAGCLAALSIGAERVAAQNGGGGRGGFGQRRIEGLRDAMDVKDDAEWKVISDQLGKVQEAQMAVLAGRMGFRGQRGGGQGGGQGGGGGEQATANEQGGTGGGQRRRGGQGGGQGGFGMQPSPEHEALQKAIDAKAPTDEIKTKLAALRDANKANQTKLTESQADLKKLLTSRQEAVAVLNGFLE